MKTLILGHHYQRPEVLQLCDYIGDSLELARRAAASDADRILFCGVRFMAESADILTQPHQEVYLSDVRAGCPMADMATAAQAETAWQRLQRVSSDWIPIVYVNSTAEVKAFCGRNGGIACTSTNAKAVLDTALKQKRQILFFPDQHLGRNTALKMGIPESAMVCWDDTAADCVDTKYGGNTAEQIQNSRIILWSGYCCVHQKFLPDHIDAIREAYTGIRVIVHPECRQDVVEKADESGSTSFILRRISESPAGSSWAVGTESRFVERLARLNPDKTVVNLAFQPSYCDTMGLIDLPKLSATLDSVESGMPINIVNVDETISTDALLCLKRMLECK